MTNMYEKEKEIIFVVGNMCDLHLLVTTDKKKNYYYFLLLY